MSSPTCSRRTLSKERFQSDSKVEQLVTLSHPNSIKEDTKHGFILYPGALAMIFQMNTLFTILLLLSGSIYGALEVPNKVGECQMLYIVSCLEACWPNNNKIQCKFYPCISKVISKGGSLSQGKFSPFLINLLMNLLKF